jgi:hypothetical protein
MVVATFAGAKLQLFFDMCKKNRNKVKNVNYDLAKEGKREEKRADG